MARAFSSNDVIQECETWIGTPYHHQESKKGLGADCVGFIRGVYYNLSGCLIEDSAYSFDWGDANGNEDLVHQAATYFNEIDPADAMPGDMLGIRWRQKRVVKHAMIKGHDNLIYHSYNGLGVIKSDFTPYTKLLARAYRFKELV